MRSAINHCAMHTIKFFSSNLCPIPGSAGNGQIPIKGFIIELYFSKK